MDKVMCFAITYSSLFSEYLLHNIVKVSYLISPQKDAPDVNE